MPVDSSVKHRPVKVSFPETRRVLSLCLSRSKQREKQTQSFRRSPGSCDPASLETGRELIGNDPRGRVIWPHQIRGGGGVALGSERGVALVMSLAGKARSKGERR